VIEPVKPMKSYSQFIDLRLSVAALLLLLTTACTESPVQNGLEENLSQSETPPNIVLIVADDLGYTDLGFLGSEIATPNLDQLAAEGLVFTNYYSSPICAPTRAQLMSGTDHHRAGQGMMEARFTGIPGYEGFMNERVVTVAERLRGAGYSTLMAGKWHLGHEDHQIPYARGFDRSFALLDGSASHYRDRLAALTGNFAEYSEDQRRIEELPDDFYSTDFYTDTMLGYIEEQRNEDMPFFAYLAYAAPHWPLQAPESAIRAQQGNYDQGYDVLRQQRFESWQATEYALDNAEIAEKFLEYPAWDDLTQEEQAISARKMEIYAAMITRMDQQIGRLISYLKETGQYENTVILFQSDNGGDGGERLPIFGAGLDGGPPDDSLENLGHPGSFAFLGPAWTEAVTAPFYTSKSFAGEGGIHVPAIAGGGAMKGLQGRSDALIMSYDVAPTLLELAGADTDAYFTTANSLPITGRSFASLLTGDEQSDEIRQENDAVAWEHGGNAAIRRGDWKLLWVGDFAYYPGTQPGPGPMSGQPMALERFDRGSPAGAPIGPGGPWRLHNLKDDPAERVDLSGQYPEIVAELLEEWNNYVSENGVIVKSGEGALSSPESSSEQ
jgi:arylsulfatase A-like enzyme